MYENFNKDNTLKDIRNKAGESIPFIGLGTYPLQGKEMASMVKSAVKEGYRLFDTADDYRGETGIGLAIEEMLTEGIIKREDLFLQTKISGNHSYFDEPLKSIYFNKNSKFMQRHTTEEIVREKVSTSLREMKTDYLDSLLIHVPLPDYIVEIWKVMIALREEGVVRYIGVSNFHKRHIELLIQETNVVPDINELYISPIGIKEDLVDYCKSIGCIPCTYSPLMDLASKRIPLNKIEPIAKKYGKSAAQIILRWNIDRGCLPLPKTKNPKRLVENFNIFDFELTPQEVATVSSLNIDFQYLVESKICPGL